MISLAELNSDPRFRKMKEEDLSVALLCGLVSEKDWIELPGEESTSKARNLLAKWKAEDESKLHQGMQAEHERITGILLSGESEAQGGDMSEQLKFRKLLWLRHGCPISVLYGDDGEMQCGKCGIDFIRDSVELIEKKWSKK
jgi:hypothetical protein